ncbi:putative toxin-antitoxin system toxin component, PIN family [Acidobacteria bacterium AH-259-O06]|nr:putative toxin-antitoxin system toxin component, PIN family [Acidobacteria bacterium AH-259-O06]
MFLDTNVLVSAFATRGLCADLLREVLVKHELVTGEVVLRELQQVLIEKLGLPGQAVSDIIGLLRRHKVVPSPEKTPPVSLRDPDDLWVLASALASAADVLVTGDRDLLAVRDKVSDLVITDPRGFWTLLRKT